MKDNKGKYRLQFLICLNKYRIAGKFKLTEFSFLSFQEKYFSLQEYVISVRKRSGRHI